MIGNTVSARDWTPDDSGPNNLSISLQPDTKSVPCYGPVVAVEARNKGIGLSECERNDTHLRCAKLSVHSWSSNAPEFRDGPGCFTPAHAPAHWQCV
jgi:hypothetical protein